MKIAIDISQIVYKGSGVEVYTENLVRSIAELDNKNQYLLFGSSLRETTKLKVFCEEFSKYANFEYKLFNLPPSILNILWNRLHKFPIDKFIGRVDVLHTSDWLEPPSFAKKVTTIHDLVVYSNPDSVNKSIVETQRQKLFWVSKESNKVIAVSNSTREDIISYLKISDKKISVIYEAANDGFKKITDKDALTNIKNKYSLPEKFFLVVGANQERKNLKRILQAHSQINSYSLVIVGNVREQIASEKVLRLGFVPENDLPAIYSLASSLVYVPLYEGFGLPILEALNCGCQVVASNVSSLPEVGGDAVFYVEPLSIDDIADKMKLSLKSPKKNLDVQAAKFSWKITALKTINLYESLA